jgi:hypothetical protein
MSLLIRKSASLPQLPQRRTFIHVSPLSSIPAT